MAYSANSVDYGLAAKHYSGNRIFYTTNNTSNIFYVEQDSYKGTTGVTAPAMGATSVSGTAM
jgi:hypothetical protein